MMLQLVQNVKSVSFDQLIGQFRINVKLGCLGASVYLLDTLPNQVIPHKHTHIGYTDLVERHGAIVFNFKLEIRSFSRSMIL